MRDALAALDLELIVPPTAELIDLAAAKAHLIVEHDDDNDLIQGILNAIVGRLDGYLGILGRCLVEQTWTWRLDAFPRRDRHNPHAALRIPLPPLIEVVSLGYVDANGIDRILDPGAYRVLAGRRAEVEPAVGGSWPNARCQSRAVTVTFKAGWPVPEDGVSWPPEARALMTPMLLILGDLYANRGDAQIPKLGNFTDRHDDLVTGFRTTFI